MITLFIININSVISDPNCPEYDSISPCRCFSISETQQQIECAGEEIDEHVLQQIASKITNSGQKFFELHIHDTKITELSANLFSAAVFTNIIVENNDDLKEVDSLAFKKETTTKLIFRRNKSLEDQRLFELARHLEPTDTIDFSSNSLLEVPENAFTTATPAKNKLKRIFLNQNKISSIHSNAFSGLPMLNTLALDFNEIQEIFEKGLELRAGTSPRNIVVKLNNNKLSETCFKRDAIVVPENVTLGLYLEYNDFTYLPQYEFKFIEKAGNSLYLTHNELSCDCSIKWIFNSPQKSNVFGLHCSNLGERNILSIPEPQVCKLSLF